MSNKLKTVSSYFSQQSYLPSLPMLVSPARSSRYIQQQIFKEETLQKQTLACRIIQRP